MGGVGRKRSPPIESGEKKRKKGILEVYNSKKKVLLEVGGGKGVQEGLSRMFHVGDKRSF